jgi:hypothetical protein
MRPFRSIAGSIGVTILLAGCGSTAPVTPSASVTVSTPVACVEFDQARCDRALGLALERLPATPSWVQVAWSLCDGPCPGEEHGAWRAHVTIEFPDGRPPVAARLEVDGAAVSWEEIETFMVAVEPQSERTNAAVLELELGHCGLASGIDVDGSFWDPVGPVDAEHPDAINAARAVFTPFGPDVATLRTGGGLAVQLIRHAGPKHLPGCD